MVPAISVIITAHNRKKFIVDAISSVLNQTLQKSFYEIIVVKNFEDKTIDNFIYRNNIKDIYLSEEPIGPKYVKGIQNSTGEITCILEDDDKFKVDKLQKVYNKFKNQQLGSIIIILS
ncbi:glycosyltransferase family A protein [Sulfuracidifex tepidarius]|uniref:glycosyltransferase family A protein n=1 Tax=Sulfuracidifex tepidarius TaxID=1294262 RepID=UPI0006D13F41|nr:glycosyltransferase family A protein [Sulfuracidifex tepidarius]